MSEQPKIEKFFNFPSYARDHSQGVFKDKAQALFGVDKEGTLFFRGAISGFSFANGWVRCPELPFTLKEMKKIVSVLGTNELQIATQEAWKLLNAAYQKEVEEFRI